MPNAKGWLSTILLVLLSGQALAQEKGCILLKTVAEIQQSTSDDKGQQITRLVPVERIAPGNEVVYTVSATNVCDQPAEAVVIAIPMPEHMTYVVQTAIGPGTEVSYSVDGGFNYGPPESLTLAAADGTQRQARPEDYTNIRWIMLHRLLPGAAAFARFRAILK